LWDVPHDTVEEYKKWKTKKEPVESRESEA
jgi:hypothetical protein